MRPDMAKVIVERPRPQPKDPRGRDGRRFRDVSDAAFLPMKAGYRDLKSLNENLRPLARYLARQVGRPWDAVYRDIRAVIDGRNAIQNHILQHVPDFVATHTRVVDGQVIDVSAQLLGVRRASQALYVHPRTGLLLRNGGTVSWRARYRQSMEEKNDKRANVWRELSPALQLHRLNDVWYAVTIAAMPPSPATAWDAARRCNVTQPTGVVRRRTVDAEAIDRFGRAGVYAASKRQLGARELRAFGLQNR